METLEDQTTDFVKNDFFEQRDFFWRFLFSQEVDSFDLK